MRNLQLNSICLNKGRKLFLILITVALSGIVIVGCAKTRVVRKSYQEMEQSFPRLEEGKGRVFIAHASPELGEAFTLKVDGRLKADIAPNNFCYIDLPIGTHTLYAALPGPPEQYGTYEMLIENGKLYYVELVINRKLFSAFNSRVRLMVNADNDDAVLRWQKFEYYH